MPTALEILLGDAPKKLGPLCAIYGGDDYLKREVLFKLRGGKAMEELASRDLEWRDVHDALTQVSLFGDDAQLVAIDDADKFVKDNRERLEAWVARPQGSRTLIIDVSTWPSNTKLYKANAKTGTAIDSGVPTDNNNKNQKLSKFTSDAKQWLTARATQVHEAPLDRKACDMLFNFLPLSVGLLDQEVAKLALVAEKGVINSALVEANVGDWRTRQTWDMIDAMVEGRAAEAIKQLDRLLAAGEHPVAIMGQVGYTLRNFAKAARMVELSEAAGRRSSLEAILPKCGFWGHKIKPGVSQLRTISRSRAKQLSRWLLEMDLAMKGHNSTAPRARLEIERLIARLSQTASPAAQARR